MNVSALIFIVFTLVSFQAYSEQNPCNTHQCIAVVDSGSTGSRVHLYSYDMDDTQSPINIKEIWSNKVKPGLANIEPNIESIHAYLNPLLSNAPYQNIPLYFYATAGMRLLPVSKQKKFYEVLHNWFLQQKQWQLIDAKTISGKDEALYDWLSVNYTKGSLQKDQHALMGIMDMGGASVQIAFPIQKKQNIDANSQIEIVLYGQHINLYVYSFLGLGQTEVAHQFLDSPSCFSNDYPLPNGTPGMGNALLCEQEISKLMEVHQVNLLVKPLLLANPVDSWYAIGGVANMADSALFDFENNQFTNQGLLQQADSAICHQPWEMLDTKFPNDDYIYQYCLFSAYYYALMVDGYGFSPEQSIHFVPPSQNLDWTLGVVLHH